MNLARASAWVMAAILLASAIWIILILSGVMGAPGEIGDVMHDSYYFAKTLLQFLTALPFTAVGLALAFWATRPSILFAGTRTATAWAALLSTALIFMGTFLVTLKPVMFTDVVRRSGEYSAVTDDVQLGYQLLMLGAALAALSVIGLITVTLKSKAN